MKIILTDEDFYYWDSKYYEINEINEIELNKDQELFINTILKAIDIPELSIFITQIATGKRMALRILYKILQSKRRPLTKEEERKQIEKSTHITNEYKEKLLSEL